MAPTESGRILATVTCAKTFSNWRPMKPGTARPVRCARRGGSSRRRSSTTAKRLPLIGRSCVRSILSQASRREKRHKLEFQVQGSRFKVQRLGANRRGETNYKGETMTKATQQKIIDGDGHVMEDIAT